LKIGIGTWHFNASRQNGATKAEKSFMPAKRLMPINYAAELLE
jgi:hypothetical protein